MTERTHEYHAVKRDGCRVIYITKAEAEIHMAEFPQALYRLFSDPGQAMDWLESPEGSDTLDTNTPSSIVPPSIERKRPVPSDTAIPAQTSSSTAGPSDPGPSKRKKRRRQRTTVTPLVPLIGPSSLSSMQPTEEEPPREEVERKVQCLELKVEPQPLEPPGPIKVQHRDDFEEQSMPFKNEPEPLELPGPTKTPHRGDFEEQSEYVPFEVPEPLEPPSPARAHRRDFTTPIPRPIRPPVPNGFVPASTVRNGTVGDSENPAESVTVVSYKLSKKDRDHLSGGSAKGDLSTGPDGGSHEPKLSAQQGMVLEMIRQGRNTFFTGSAGTGKSVLLRAIIRYFREMEEEGVRGARYFHKVDQSDEPLDAEASLSPPMNAEAVVAIEGSGARKTGRPKWALGVTASTGIAGVNIGGSTLHSWAGIGLGDQPKEALLEQILKHTSSCRRWRESRALLIDEVSMLSAELFDKLEWLGRQIRRSDEPFGGLQIILSGDFFQLPPVSKQGQPEALYAFEAKSWDSVLPAGSLVSLTKVFRQADSHFVDLLDSLRRGTCSNAELAILSRCDRVVQYDDGIEPVSLYPTKKEVFGINTGRLKLLETPMVEYRGRDTPGRDSKNQKVTQERATCLLDERTLWPKTLQLKVGAMIMLICNMGDDVLVNGSTGVIVDFMTISEARQASVYLPPRAGFYHHHPDSVWPVVKFMYSKHARGQQYDRAIIPGMSVDVMNADHKPEATRDQVPLILAWALTIHKSQGQTLERVRVDAQRVFTPGQTYVAISRAVSLDGLELRNMSKHRVRSHPKVNIWDQRFASSSASKDSDAYNLEMAELLDLAEKGVFDEC